MKKTNLDKKPTEAFYKSLIENTIDAIIILNIDGSIRYQSPSVQNITGYTHEERAQLGMFALIHPDDLPEVVNSFKKLLNTQLSTSKMECRIKHKDGSWHIVETLIKNLINDPLISGIALNVRDITERKLTEDALKESEERYRQLANNIKDIIWITDEYGRITYISPSVTNHLGYTVEEAISQSLGKMLTPASLDVLYTYCSKIFTGQNNMERDVSVSHILDMELCCKDGSIIWTETSITQLLNSEGKLSGILGVTRNISERKRMAQDLSIKENALENSLNAMAMSDMSGNITYVNRATLKMWGNNNKDDIIGKPYWHLLMFDETIPAEEIAESMFKNGFWEGELVAKRVDGKEICLQVFSNVVKDDQGHSIQTISSFIDITERKETEKALKASEEKFKRFVEEMNDCYCVLQDNMVVFVNERGAEMFGYTREEVLGKNIQELLSPEVFNELVKINAERHSGAKILPQYETSGITKNSKVIPIELGARIIEYNGRPAISAVIRNITERKRSEDDKHRLEQQLLLAGRLAAVGELAAGVAHELNNPLAAVSGYAQFLASSETLDESVRKDIETIYQNAQRAARITSNLLSFARRHKPEKNLISINGSIAQSLDLNAYRMKVNNINIEVELDPNLPDTMADYHQLQQVFVNIITNAEQAMIESNGKGKLLVKTKTVGNMIRIEFTDDGPGIPEENLTRIFDPFFTTKEVGKGTGLGLSICYGIINQHDGRLHAESKLGVGTTFVVELPIISEVQYVH